MKTAIRKFRYLYGIRGFSQSHNEDIGCQKDNYNNVEDCIKLNKRE